MKKQICLILLVAAAATGQPAPTPPAPAGGQNLPGRKFDPYAAASEAPKLTKFNLDFPGGNPKQLVAAIDAATGRPLNVVIPDEYANDSIPALRMTQVNVADLFRAMEQASVKSEPYRTGSYYGAAGQPGYTYQQIQTTLSFQTAGPVSDDSIWYFRGRQKVPDFSAGDTKPAPAKLCRFYALTPYLDQGLKVEDITTAIQTGWKMLGEKETPTISFHKETKLLIAVGEPAKLETIDLVLSALRPGLPSFSDRLNNIIRGPAAPLPPKPTPTPAPPAPPTSEP